MASEKLLNIFCGSKNYLPKSLIISEKLDRICEKQTISYNFVEKIGKVVEPGNWVVIYWSHTKDIRNTAGIVSLL